MVRFAEYCCVDVDRLNPVPFHLDPLQASAFPLGGLTAFRALFRHGCLQAGQNVLVSGFGGGVAQFAFFICESCSWQMFTLHLEAMKKLRVR